MHTSSRAQHPPSTLAAAQPAHAACRTTACAAGASGCCWAANGLPRSSTRSFPAASPLCWTIPCWPACRPTSWARCGGVQWCGRATAWLGWHGMAALLVAALRRSFGQKAAGKILTHGLLCHPVAIMCRFWQPWRRLQLAHQTPPGSGTWRPHPPTLRLCRRQRAGGRRQQQTTGSAGRLAVCRGRFRRTRRSCPKVDGWSCGRVLLLRCAQMQLRQPSYDPTALMQAPRRSALSSNTQQTWLGSTCLTAAWCSCARATQVG